MNRHIGLPRICMKTQHKSKKGTPHFVIYTYPRVRKLFNETGNDPDEHVRKTNKELIFEKKI